jgi:hypothetical protein
MQLPPYPCITRSLTVLASASLLISHASARPEAFEVTPATQTQLPRGKEADGIVGDFILRNDKVEAVISGNLPLRRANMSTFYGADGITPGCLYDLTLRGANNDQITIFSPAQQQGAVSWVRLAAEPGSEKETSIECVVTAETGRGIYRRHVYTIKDGWSGVKVTTTLRNETDKPVAGPFRDRWTNFLKTGYAPGDILWANAVDPDDRCGYAVGPLEDSAGALSGALLELKPGASITFTRFLAVERSPSLAVGEVLAQKGLRSRLSGSVFNKDGKPVKASVWIRPMYSVSVPVPATGKPASNQPDSNGRLSGIAYPDAEGRFECILPEGKYRVTVSSEGRPDQEKEVEITANAASHLEYRMAEGGNVAIEITDESGVSLPCKAQFLAMPGTEPVNLGPDQRAHGCRDQYHSERGKFEVPIPPGKYRVVITRGIEYGHLSREIELKAGETVRVAGVLKRLVDTKGWVSADYHNHSTPSGDNICGTADRLINLAAEHIEFAPTTEHNRIYDWRPEIERLGLSAFLQTVSGIENTGSKAHFNAFPFEPVPFTQDNGAPVWNADPRITALTLREWQKPEPDRWVQINHPDLFANFFEKRATGDKEHGYAGLVRMIDGYETQNYGDSRILDLTPFTIGRTAAGAESVVWQREFQWLQMLNQGRITAAVAVCDAHSVFGNGVGGWRMYMPSSSDEPAKIDWRENTAAAKKGCSYLTTGPFLQVQAADGTLPGGTTRSKNGKVTLKVRVQCTDWIDIDRVQVLVNGRAPESLNFKRSSHAGDFKNGVVKFEREVEVPVKEDAHLIVVACGESHTLALGYGSSPQASIHPLAYHNPVYIDTDGNGFQPNGDLLDFPITGEKVGVEEAKKFLESRKRTR